MRRLFYMPGVPPEEEAAEIARLEALVADLRAYRSGAIPTESEIRRAPLVSDWHPVADVWSFRFAGQVGNHPSVGPGPGVTSRVCALDADGRWMRSFSRLWRLGPSADLDRLPH